MDVITQVPKEKKKKGRVAATSGFKEGNASQENKALEKSQEPLILQMFSYYISHPTGKSSITTATEPTKPSCGCGMLKTITNAGRMSKHQKCDHGPWPMEPGLKFLRQGIHSS